MVEPISMAAAAAADCRCLTCLAIAERSCPPSALFVYLFINPIKSNCNVTPETTNESGALASPVPYLRSVVGGWTGEAAVRSEEVPGKKDSASMAVKGERDPAACAHIHPTSSRKPAVAEATLLVGGAAARAPLQRGG